MIKFALTLLLLAAQPDDGPVSTQQVVPPPSAAALEEVRRKAADQAVKDEAERERALEEWRTTSTPPPEPAARPAPAQPELSFDEAVAASRAARNTAPKGRLGFGTPAQPQTEEERIAAANAAALARAEQAGQEVNAPPGAWPDDGRMRCKPTDNGIVCGNSDAALEPDSPSRQALDALLNPD